MELLYELLLTLSFSLILTSLFIRLLSITPSFVANKYDEFTKEDVRVDEFQCMPLKDEAIKVTDYQDEGKSVEDKIRDIAVDDGNKLEETLEEEHDHEEFSPGLDGNEMERKMSAIGIGNEEEEVECESGKDEMIDDWEEIGRKDFEELIGNKEGFYNFDLVQ